MLFSVFLSFFLAGHLYHKFYRPARWTNAKEREKRDINSHLYTCAVVYITKEVPRPAPPSFPSRVCDCIVHVILHVAEAGNDRSTATMSGTPALAFDEFGRPFIIIRDQSSKRRLKGIEAHKVSENRQLCVCTRIAALSYICPPTYSQPRCVVVFRLH